MSIDVYLEVGSKRTFAGAIDWPGWCRSAKTEEAALESLAAYAARYGKVVARSRLGFTAPSGSGEFVVGERLTGNATTDFGAPGRPTGGRFPSRSSTGCDASSKRAGGRSTGPPPRPRGASSLLGRVAEAGSWRR